MLLAVEALDPAKRALANDSVSGSNVAACARQRALQLDRLIG